MNESDSVAERRYALSSGDTVRTQIFAPRNEDGHWLSDYVVIWPDRERRHFGAGADSMQALLVAMQTLHADLLASPEAKAGELTLDGDRDLGLPLPARMTPDDFA